MKYLPLVWVTLWRKKTRTIFTLASILIAFLLFGVLKTVDDAFEHPSGGVSGADKLITTNKYSITLPLPFADGQQIGAVPGVAAVTWLTWFGAYYQESKNFVFALPIDTDSYFKVYDGELVVSDDAMRDFRMNRRGTLVNSALMTQFGWKVGDRIPLHSTIWTQGATGRSTGRSTSSAPSMRRIRRWRARARPRSFSTTSCSTRGAPTKRAR